MKLQESFIPSSEPGVALEIVTAKPSGDPTPPDVAAQRVLNIAAYLIANGLVIQDGQTMEVAPGEVIRAKYADRGHRPGTAAVQLSLERRAAGPTTPPPGPRVFGRRGTT